MRRRRRESGGSTTQASTKTHVDVNNAITSSKATTNTSSTTTTTTTTKAFPNTGVPIKVSFPLEDQLPTHSRGVYYGGWDDINPSVYERTTALLLRHRGRPLKHHVLVQVHAVSLNPVDAKRVIGDKLAPHWTTARKWAHNAMVKDTRVGFDFAGIVVVPAVAARSSSSSSRTFDKGTRVFGTMPPFQGSCADYIFVPIHQIAEAPHNLSLEECAALPLVGLTAWQALSPSFSSSPSSSSYIGHRDDSSISNNVLIIGGSGGTGHVALQVAKALVLRGGDGDGATTTTTTSNRVVTICSTPNVDFCRKCGATDVIDYRTIPNNKVLADLLEPLGPFDVILDCVTSGDPDDGVQQAYPANLRDPSAGLVTPHHLYQRLGGPWSDWIRAGMARLNIFPHSWIWKDPRERLFWIRFPHTRRDLEELVDLVTAGHLRPRLLKVYEGLSAMSVQQAFDDLLSRRVQGKVVIRVRSEELIRTSETVK